MRHGEFLPVPSLWLSNLAAGDDGGEPTAACASRCDFQLDYTRRHLALVGAFDVRREAAEKYLADQEADGRSPAEALARALAKITGYKVGTSRMLQQNRFCKVEDIAVGWRCVAANEATCQRTMQHNGCSQVDCMCP